MYTRKDTVFLQMATLLGTLGTCDRASVGAIIVKEGRAISWGYNGALPSMPHCNENNHGWGEDYRSVESFGCRNVMHAEANAICFAARQGISTEGCTLYTEMSPCENCARLIVSSGISRVIYRAAYRDETGISVLRRAFVLAGEIDAEQA